MTPQAHDRALEAMLANCTDTDYNDKEDLQGGLDYLRFISDSFMKKDVTFLLVSKYLWLIHCVSGLLLKLKDEHPEFIVEHYLAKNSLSVAMSRRLLLQGVKL